MLDSNCFGYSGGMRWAYKQSETPPSSSAEHSANKKVQKASLVLSLPEFTVQARGHTYPASLHKHGPGHGEQQPDGDLVLRPAHASAQEAGVWQQKARLNLHSSLSQIHSSLCSNGVHLGEQYDWEQNQLCVSSPGGGGRKKIPCYGTQHYFRRQPLGGGGGVQNFFLTHISKISMK